MSLAGPQSPRTDPRGGDSAAPETMRAALAEAALTVRRYLFGMCGQWDLAEDLAQETLLKAWQRREGFDGRASIRTWLFRIARNTWLDSLRRRKVRDHAAWKDTMDVPDASPSPAEAAHRGELAAAVAAALTKLPAEQREALALRESEGLTFEQIAGVLGVPAATVKSRVRYALTKLAEHLREYQ